ncbi:MAG: DNA polymerase III subunit delta [Prevotella sp.]|nr:DNA polymerase III subunit delta [Prevotella sp.]
MAEKKSGPTFDSIMRDLKARNFSPIYFLMGEEPYYIDRIADFVAENALDEAERDFNQTIVFGADTTSAQIADMARRYPMMAERQVIIVKEAQNLRSLEPLAKYAEKPTPTTVLVLCNKNGVLDRRKKANSALISSIEKNGGVVFESKKKSDRELPGFIETYLTSKKATIDYKATQMIAEHIGSDLNRLISELDKVLISMKEGDRRITPEIVEREIGVSKDFNTFELRSAIINRDVYKANLIVKYFDNNPKAGSLYSILPMLFNYFQNLMIAYYAPSKTDENIIARHLDLKSGWAARDYKTGLRNFTGTKTLQIISKMREIDAKGKGIENPNTGQGELMKELIFFILH